MTAIALCLGDPAGIGPEVTAKALSGRKHGPPILMVGPEAALLKAAFRSGLTPFWHPYPTDGTPLQDHKVYLHDLPGPLPEAGKTCAEGGKLAMTALDHALALVRDGICGSLVTAPLSKEAVRLAGYQGFSGHTEYLATDGHDVRMMMATEKLKVVLVTTHHPLAEVPKLINADKVYDTIRLTREVLVRHGGYAAPRIAVCGLNPHPGEFGDEDAKYIAPAVARARRDDLNVDGPLSADALFGRVVREDSYDVVVAMYHDQGLVPVKLLGGGVVNITLGLPFVRTSPGHGTGFDIAGKGLADPTSMSAAIATACQWTTQ